jgi:hypothetical protein
VVVAAGDSTSERCRTALTELCEAYWYPLYVFLRRKGLLFEEAQDLVQSFLADFLARMVGHAARHLGCARSAVVSPSGFALLRSPALCPISASLLLYALYR